MLETRNYAEEFTSGEVMVTAGARELKDGEIAIIGVGPSQVAGILAKYTHAPRLKILLEIGIIDPMPIHPAIGLADTRIWYGCSCMTSWLDVMGMSLHRGIVDVGFLSGNQVDEYGNINTTMIGTLTKPIKHFTGSGGANGIASLAKRILILMRHEKRRFPKRVDFITSPGYIDGSEGRMKAGLRPGGPTKVITNLAVLGFDEKTRRMKLLSLHPNVNVKDVIENTGFDLFIPKKVPVTAPPTVEEQKIIRTIADVTGVVTGWTKQ